MILIDANLLIHAYHPRAAQHDPSRTWLEATLSGSELVRFAWVTLWAFLRNSTNHRVFERPLTMGEAETAVSSWLARPVAGLVKPGERHWEILQKMMRDGQVTGPLVTDAIVAAIAIEHAATLCTTDDLKVDESARRGGGQVVTGSEMKTCTIAAIPATASEPR